MIGLPPVREMKESEKSCESMMDWFKLLTRTTTTGPHSPKETLYGAVSATQESHSDQANTGPAVSTVLYVKTMVLTVAMTDWSLKMENYVIFYVIFLRWIANIKRLVRTTILQKQSCFVNVGLQRSSTYSGNDGEPKQRGRLATLQRTHSYKAHVVSNIKYRFV